MGILFWLGVSRSCWRMRNTPLGVAVSPDWWKKNLWVSVKRVTCQTTRSLEGVQPYVNRLKAPDICRRDQVWVGDITYVRLKGGFVYVAVLTDVFTRMIRRWKLSQHLMQSLTLKPVEQALFQSVPEIYHSDQGVEYLLTAYISTLTLMGLRFH